MKKRLIDLTIEEVEKICDTNESCLNCPCCIHNDFEEACWKELVESGIKNIEVEVLENGKD